MMVVTVATDTGFHAGIPEILFEGNFVLENFDSGATNYDVTPDGQHFLMIKAIEEEVAGQINVILNWFEELKRLVPTDN